MKLRYFGHSACQFTTKNGLKILIDPFLNGNPVSPVKSSEIEADFIILTHAHGDHVGDTIEIAKRCNSTVICNFELGNILEEEGLKIHSMHIGGGYNFEFGRVKFTIAHHGSSYPDGRYGGNPAGIILNIDGLTLYHTGDTGLFLDMKLIGELNKIDYMLLPIGDNYTMGIDDAVIAVEFVNPKNVIPLHFNTFPVIEANPQEFKRKIESVNKECIVMDFGQEIIL
jgi:L-ascorbate metabolism protein UlaG (beta-lactamase superfamily)